MTDTPEPEYEQLQLFDPADFDSVTPHPRHLPGVEPAVPVGLPTVAWFVDDDYLHRWRVLGPDGRIIAAASIGHRSRANSEADARVALRALIRWDTQ